MISLFKFFQPLSLLRMIMLSVTIEKDFDSFNSRIFKFTKHKKELFHLGHNCYLYYNFDVNILQLQTKKYITPQPGWQALLKTKI